MAKVPDSGFESRYDEVNDHQSRLVTLAAPAKEVRNDLTAAKTLLGMREKKRPK